MVGWTWTLTFLFIIGSVLVGLFVSGRSRDKCLKDFNGQNITLIDKEGAKVTGMLDLESTGMEVAFAKLAKVPEGQEETSYILYKNEYPNISMVIRYLSDLDEENRLWREKDLRRTYHPNCVRRYKRKFRNVANTFKDSLLEMVNLVVGQVKKSSGAGVVLSGQDKYVGKIKKDVVGYLGASFDPLLEAHIGHKVIVEAIAKEAQKARYVGILKEYTSEFLEVMDVALESDKTGDVIFPRRIALVRHGAE